MAQNYHLGKKLRVHVLGNNSKIAFFCTLSLIMHLFPPFIKCLNVLEYVLILTFIILLIHSLPWISCYHALKSTWLNVSTHTLSCASNVFHRFRFLELVENNVWVSVTLWWLLPVFSHLLPSFWIFFSFCSLHKANFFFLFYRYFHIIFPSFINSANLSLLIRNRTKPRQNLNSLLLFLTEKVVLNMFQEFKGFCVRLFRFVVCGFGFFSFVLVSKKLCFLILTCFWL